MVLGRMAGTVKHGRQWHTCCLEVMQKARLTAASWWAFPWEEGFTATALPYFLLVPSTCGTGTNVLSLKQGRFPLIPLELLDTCH